MRLAATDGREEATFLRAMLEAPMHTLAPLSDDHPRQRIFMFGRPDGVFFVPLFTNETSALASAEGLLRVLSGTGRQLLELTRGATVVINPNDEHCFLYPEEIEALLTASHVATINMETTCSDRQVWIGDPTSRPMWLLERLRTLYTDLSFVEAARLAYIAPLDAPEKGLLTIIIVTSRALTERAARATLIAIQDDCIQAGLSIDITAVASEDPNRPLSRAGLLIYTKSM